MSREEPDQRALITHYERSHHSFSFQLKTMIEHHFLNEKVTLIKEIGDHLSILESMKGDDYGLGEYTFDKNLQWQLSPLNI